MEITVLCRVVDNFGDIGVAYRLVKSLVELGRKSEEDKAKINLVVDDMEAFSKINNRINPSLSFQEMDGMCIYAWNDYDFCYRQFSGGNNVHLQVILELFQCGRPDWMEKILFDEDLNHTVNIIMIDYLTAEDYAETFHCLESLTRRKKVQKVNFMPGFTEKTGGLILGKEFERKTSGDKKCEKILFFCYDRIDNGWLPVVRAVNSLKNETELLVAQGKGMISFMEAASQIKEKERHFVLKQLSFMNQEEWDELMISCSFLFIRGEESLSRACLMGIPFVWHAYPQSDEYQLVKVNALLERMRRHFKPDDFEAVRKVWIDFNAPREKVDNAAFEEDVRNLLVKKDELSYGFEDFAKDLRKNGDLAYNLMTFIKKDIII